MDTLSDKVDVRGAMFIVVRNGHGNTSSNSGATDSISQSPNTLRNGIHPIITPLAMGK